MLTPRSSPLLSVFGILGTLAPGIAVPLQSAEAPPAPGAPFLQVTQSAGNEATGSVTAIALGSSGSVTVTSSGSIVVASDKIQIGSSTAGVSGEMIITTTGPDGQSHTVRRSLGGAPGGGAFSVTGPDGKPLAMSVHARPSQIRKVSYAGLMVHEAPEILSKHLPVPAGVGLVVLEISKGSPAEKAGLRKDDVLLRFDDQLLANSAQLRTLTRAKKPGDKVRFSLLREGKESVVEVVMGEHEEDTANPGSGPWKPFWMKEGMPEWMSHLGARWMDKTREHSPDMHRKFGDTKEHLEEVRRDLEYAKRRAEEAARHAQKLAEEALRRPGPHHPPGPPPAPEDLHQRLDRLEEELGRLRAELHRQGRERPPALERKDPPGERPAPAENGGPEGREGRRDKSGPPRPPGPPTAPPPPPPVRGGQ